MIVEETTMKNGQREIKSLRIGPHANRWDLTPQVCIVDPLSAIDWTMWTGLFYLDVPQ